MPVLTRGGNENYKRVGENVGQKSLGKSAFGGRNSFGACFSFATAFNALSANGHWAPTGLCKRYWWNAKIKRTSANLAKRLAKKKALKAKAFLQWYDQKSQENHNLVQESQNPQENHTPKKNCRMLIKNYLGRKRLSWRLIRWWRWGAPFFPNQKVRMRLMNVYVSFLEGRTKSMAPFVLWMKRKNNRKIDWKPCSF